MPVLTHRLRAPFRLEAEHSDRIPGPDGPESVRVRLLAGAICGSDLAKYRGVPDPRWPHDGQIGFPLHEVVGRLADGEAGPGERVIGMSSEFRGLAEEFRADPALLVPVPDGLCDVHATMIQPLATVLCAVERIGDPAGRRVVVIGLGSIGALFAHVLARRGAARVVAVDPVPRADLAPDLGVDETVLGTARGWTATGDVAGVFDICVEAVGHQQQTFADSVRLAAPGGRIVAFGVPDDSHYAVPMVEMFRKQLTVQLGETTDWARHLRAAGRYVLEHAASLGGYITDVYPLARADEAFRAAATAREGQLKIALSTDATGPDRPCVLAPVARRHDRPGPAGEGAR